MNHSSDQAVSPVVGVILVVAVTVVLSAAIGAFVLNLGQSTTSDATQQELGVQTSISNGQFSVTVVTGTAEKLAISVNGTETVNKTNVSPGDTLTTSVNQGDRIAVVTTNSNSSAALMTETITTQSTETTTLSQDLIVHHTLDASTRNTETLVDGMEDGGFAEYVEQTGNPVSGDGPVVQTTTKTSGEYGLRTSINDYTLLWKSTTGLPHYPTAGDTIQVKYRASNEASRSGIRFFQSGGGGYKFEFRYAEGGTRLATANGVVLNSTSSLPPAGEWMTITVETTPGGGPMEATVTNASGGTVLTLTGSDTTSTTGGVSFYHSSANTANTFYWDDLKILNDERVSDASGNANHGYVHDNPSFVSDSDRGKVAEFDGSNDHIRTNVSVNGSSWSVAYWGKWDTPIDNNEGVVALNTKSNDLFVLNQRGDQTNDPHKAVVKIDGTFYDTGTDVPTPSAGTWYHEIVVYENNELTVYRNGQKVASRSTSGSMNDITEFVVGANDLQSEFHDGRLDGARLYRGALTQQEASDLYNATK